MLATLVSSWMQLLCKSPSNNEKVLETIKKLREQKGDFLNVLLLNNCYMFFHCCKHQKRKFSESFVNSILVPDRTVGLQCSGLYLKCTLTTEKKSKKHCPRSF